MDARDAKASDTALRDELALERTRLAEERTCLAYLRTGMSTLLGGFFFIGYFTEAPYTWIGYGTVAVSLAFIVYGFYKHRKTAALLERVAGAMGKLRR